MNDNYLIHFGNKNSGRYPRGSGERPHQHDGLRARISKKKDRLENRIERRETARDSYKLSNEELDRHITRLDKENRLKDLTKRVNSGRGEVNKNLKKAGGIATGAVIGAAAGAGGKALVKKISEKAGTITLKKAAKAGAKAVGKQVRLY